MGDEVGLYVVTDDLPPVVTSWPRNLSASGDLSAIVAIYLDHDVLLGLPPGPVPLACLKHITLFPNLGSGVGSNLCHFHSHRVLP